MFIENHKTPSSRPTLLAWMRLGCAAVVGAFVMLGAGAPSRETPRGILAAEQSSIFGGSNGSLRQDGGRERIRPDLGRPREFYFTRAVYTGYYRFRDFRSWSVDFPKADRQFLIGLRRLTNVDAYELENPVRLSDVELRRYPLLYAVETGYMALTEAEVEGLRGYLEAGGFLVIDDFWGSFEWENFESQIQRVLPGSAIADIPLSHPIFSCFYDVKEILQVPNVGQGMRGGPTWESDGYVPAVKGIFDERGRLMVVINWNTDLGDAWEWAENPYYPLKFSTYAYQMGVNYIIYAMSH